MLIRGRTRLVVLLFFPALSAAQGSIALKNAPLEVNRSEIFFRTSDKRIAQGSVLWLKFSSKVGSESQYEALAGTLAKPIKLPLTSLEFNKIERFLGYLQEGRIDDLKNAELNKMALEELIFLWIKAAIVSIRELKLVLVDTLIERCKAPEFLAQYALEPDYLTKFDHVPELKKVLAAGLLPMLDENFLRTRLYTDLRGIYRPTCCALNPSNSLLAVAGKNDQCGFIDVWNPFHGTLIQRIDTAEPISQVHFHVGPEVLAVTPHRIGLWNLVTKELKTLILGSELKKKTHSMWGLTPSENYHLFAFGIDSRLYVADFSSATCRKMAVPEFDAKKMTKAKIVMVGKRNPVVVLTLDDGTVLFFCSQTGEFLSKESEHTSAISHAYSYDSQCVTVSNSGEVCRWDCSRTSAKRLLKKSTLPAGAYFYAPKGKPTSIEPGKRIAFFDEMDRHFYEKELFLSGIHGVSEALAVDDRGEVWAYDADGHAVLLASKGGTRKVLMSFDGSFVVSISESNVIRVWHFFNKNIHAALSKGISFSQALCLQMLFHYLRKQNERTSGARVDMTFLRQPHIADLFMSLDHELRSLLYISFPELRTEFGEKFCAPRNAFFTMAPENTLEGTQIIDLLTREVPDVHHASGEASASSQLPKATSSTSLPDAGVEAPLSPRTRRVTIGAEVVLDRPFSGSEKQRSEIKGILVYPADQPKRTVSAHGYSPREITAAPSRPTGLRINLSTISVKGSDSPREQGSNQGTPQRILGTVSDEQFYSPRGAKGIAAVNTAASSQEIGHEKQPAPGPVTVVEKAFIEEVSLDDETDDERSEVSEISTNSTSSSSTPLAESSTSEHEGSAQATVQQLLKKGEKAYYSGKFEEAFRSLNSAVELDGADNNEQLATWLLGEMYLSGRGTDSSFTKARQMFEQTVSSSSDSLLGNAANERLGELYYFGYIDKDTSSSTSEQSMRTQQLATARKLFEKALAGTLPPEVRARGLFLLGELVKTDQSSSNEEALAAALQVQALELCNSLAKDENEYIRFTSKMILATIYLGGTGSFQKTPSQGNQLYKPQLAERLCIEITKSSQKHLHPEAWLRLGQIYLMNEATLKAAREAFSKARREPILHRAAYARASLELGHLYAKSVGTNKNTSSALLFYRDALDQKYDKSVEAEAAYSLARLYEKGASDLQSEPIKVYMFDKRASELQPWNDYRLKALLKVAENKEDSAGYCPQDVAQACTYYEMILADATDTALIEVAREHLAKIYSEGKGNVAKNSRKALVQYTWLAEKSSRPAMRHNALFRWGQLAFSTGDLREARHLLDQAAALNDDADIKTHALSLLVSLLKKESE